MASLLFVWMDCSPAADHLWLGRIEGPHMGVFGVILVPIPDLNSFFLSCEAESTPFAIEDHDVRYALAMRDTVMVRVLTSGETSTRWVSMSLPLILSVIPVLRPWVVVVFLVPFPFLMKRTSSEEMVISPRMH